MLVTVFTLFKNFNLLFNSLSTSRTTANTVGPLAEGMHGLNQVYQVPFRSYILTYFTPL